MDVARVRKGSARSAPIGRPQKNRWRSGCTGARSPSSCERRAPIENLRRVFYSRSACSPRPTIPAPSSTCTDPSAEHPENIINATIAGSAETLERLLADRRQVTTNSSCGLCGRLTIESLRIDAPPITSTWTIDAATLVAIPNRLREAQKVFEETGGLHAAGLFTPNGKLEAMAEDVGRHNAVDKVVGRMLMQDRLPLSDFLPVRQRTNFLRDLTEGVSRWNSRRGCGVRTVESCDRPGARVRSYARRVPPWAGLQRLRSSRTDCRLRIVRSALSARSRARGL